MFYKALTVTVCAAAVAAGLTGPASAVASRPDFQLPFVCDGKVWRGETRANHSPRLAVDFNWGSGSDDQGEPVVASAGGTVVTAGPSGSGYGNYVIVGHGDGWSSLYAHLRGIAVQVGDRVRSGQRIGSVGMTGGTSSAPHLHYEQRRNGNDVAAVIDGFAVPYPAGGDWQGNFRSHNCGDDGPDIPADLSVSGVADEDGTLTVFARRDGHLETNNKSPDGQWGGWVSRGGNLASGPDAVLSAASNYHVVARGENGKVHYKRQNATGWGDWNTGFSDFDTPFAPAIVRIDNDTLMAFAVRASDKALMKRRFQAGSDGGWEDWTVLGDEKGFTSGPDAAVRDNGAIDIVIRGAGGFVKHAARRTDGTWTDFRPLGDLKSAPGAAPAVATRGNVIDILARGEHGAVWRNIHNDDGWSGWHLTALGRFNQGPDLVTDSRGGALLALGRDTDGRIVRAGWNPGEGWSDTLHIPAS
ncbi:MAG TPA: peptidoglycan DD-metalloendopeptidase family protein [Candidatus Limnocylindrales bacterium]